MRVQTYYRSLNVKLLNVTKHAESVLQLALNTTMKQEVKLEDHQIDQYKISKDQLIFLIRAGHTSVLEHVNFQFYIQGISRSCMAQLTRHRMCSFTVGSQHYQDYRNYPVSVSKKLSDHAEIFNTINHEYEKLIDTHKIPHDEARQILPIGKTCNILWTINLRSLWNFLSIRMCLRNIDEMVFLANKVQDAIALTTSGPISRLITMAGPDCLRFDRHSCAQGKMICDTQPVTWSDYEEYIETLI